MKKFTQYIILLLFSFIFTCDRTAFIAEWPEITLETKPWTRWWWMGSTVNKKDLTFEMEKYKKAGLGGMEITPIYGVMGYEDKYIQYLSPEWMDLFLFTLQEAERLDLGIDMATGTGWPFGGPWIGAADACKNVDYKIYHLREGKSLNEPVKLIQKPLVRSVTNQIYQLYGNILREKGEKIEGSLDQPLLQPETKPLDINQIKEPISANNNLQAVALEQVKFEKELPLQVLMAYSDKDEILNITNKVEKNGRLSWTAPEGNWTLYAVFQGWHGKMVERAAPGGEGNVIDHFSGTALKNYFMKFDQGFSGSEIKSFRSFFNDSYEVDDARGQADWTPLIFDEFKNHQGYELQNFLPALFGHDSQEKNYRVLSDYRETISELLLKNFTESWQKWAKSKNKIIRNQAHGSPANILDLYAASDIPETEGTDLLRIKFASSAAHVSGKKLTSSESATWLDEHFTATLSDVKKNLDRYLLGGVNHIFYHGTTFSPQAEQWPGWMFYASVHFGPTNTFWKDFSALNEYVARCQSVLQAGQPHNDILLYFPFHDRLAVPGKELLEHFSGGGPQEYISEVRNIAQQLTDRGYSFDFISDKQIQNIQFSQDFLQVGGNQYQTIVLPACHFIPLQTFRKLIELADTGAAVIVNKKMPQDVPGLGNLSQRRIDFKSLLKQLNFNAIDSVELLEAKVGKGIFLLSQELATSLNYAKVEREEMVEQGLQFIRRKEGKSSYYFIVNGGKDTIDGWVPLLIELKSAAIFNPLNGRIARAALRNASSGLYEVYLQLNPGESCILKTYTSEINISDYPYFKIIGNAVELKGSWTIRFVEGGPELPPVQQVSVLSSWTELGEDIYKKFSGTAVYSTTFSKPFGSPAGWQLDLGQVKESAEVQLNGKPLGTLFSPPYQVYIPKELFKENNTLTVNVSNLMANRIADLDQRNIPWKKFYNINFPARRRENRDKNGLFTASNWAPKPSGLIGPVKLIPVNLKNL